MHALLSFLSISVFGVGAIPIYSNGRLFVFVQGIVFSEGRHSNVFRWWGPPIRLCFVTRHLSGALVYIGLLLRQLRNQEEEESLQGTGRQVQSSFLGYL